MARERAGARKYFCIGIDIFKEADNSCLQLFAADNSFDLWKQCSQK